MREGSGAEGGENARAGAGGEEERGESREGSFLTPSRERLDRVMVMVATLYPPHGCKVLL